MHLKNGLRKYFTEMFAIFLFTLPLNHSFHYKRELHLSPQGWNITVGNIWIELKIIKWKIFFSICYHRKMEYWGYVITKLDNKILKNSKDASICKMRFHYNCICLQTWCWIYFYLTLKFKNLKFLDKKGNISS